MFHFKINSNSTYIVLGIMFSNGQISYDIFCIITIAQHGLEFMCHANR